MDEPKTFEPGRVWKAFIFTSPVVFFVGLMGTTGYELLRGMEVGWFQGILSGIILLECVWIAFLTRLAGHSVTLEDDHVRVDLWSERIELPYEDIERLEFAYVPVWKGTVNIASSDRTFHFMLKARDLPELLRGLTEKLEEGDHEARWDHQRAATLYARSVNNVQMTQRLRDWLPYLALAASVVFLSSALSRIIPPADAAWADVLLNDQLLIALMMYSGAELFLIKNITDRVTEESHDGDRPALADPGRDLALEKRAYGALFAGTAALVAAANSIILL